MKKWFFEKSGETYKDWPKQNNGDPVPPAFLMHLGGTETEAAIIFSLLRAYNIPTMRRYPNNGDFAKVIIGLSGVGMDVYVPETMLDEAHDILNSKAVYTEEP